MAVFNEEAEPEVVPRTVDRIPITVGIRREEEVDNRRMSEVVRMVQVSVAEEGLAVEAVADSEEAEVVIMEEMIHRLTIPRIRFRGIQRTRIAIR